MKKISCIFCLISAGFITQGQDLAVSVQPTNLTVLNGGNAVFHAVVSGVGPFTYQWQFNGTNLSNNIISTVAGMGSSPKFSGDHGAATNASLNFPADITKDAVGNLFIADNGNHRVRKVDTNGIIITVAGNGSSNPLGDGHAATNAGMGPVGVTFDTFGNLLIADASNARVRKIDTNGIISTLAGNGNQYYAGDGGFATNASMYVAAVAVDTVGNIFIADQFNQRVRKVDTNGIITTVAGNGSTTQLGDGGQATNASIDAPMGLALDKSNDLFIAEGFNPFLIRKVDTKGIITTVAGGGTNFPGDGGMATNASLVFNSIPPAGIYIDKLNNLYVADFSHNRIRKVDTNGIITTVAGNGGSGFSGDGGFATNADIYFPAGIHGDAYGNLFIVSTSSQRVRKVSNTQGSTLLLNDVSAGSVGNYSIVVSSDSASITSSVANLTVTLPPLTESIVGNGQTIQLKLNGAASQNYILQMADTLVSPIQWQSIYTNLANTSGIWSFTNSTFSISPNHFYRVTVP